MVHGLQGGQVHAQGVGDTGQVKTKLQQQVNKVQLLARERVVDLGAGQVALRPGTVVQAVVAALVVMVTHVMHVVLVEPE